MEFNFKNPGGNNLTNSENSEDSPKKSSKKIIVLLLVLFLIVGVGAYYLFFADSSGEDSGTAVSSSAVNKNESDISTSPTVSADLAQNNSLNSKQNEISGVTVGGLFIPYGFDEKAIEFLQKLKSQGQFPIVVDEGTLGKTNPF